MSAFAALVWKDVVLYFSNRRALLVSVAAPIAIAAFFGSLFGGGSGGQGPSKVPIAMVDHDGSAMSRALVDAMKGDATFDVRPLAEAEAVDAVHRGGLRALLVIPPTFGDAAPRALFGGGTRPVVEIRYDPSQAITLQVVEGLLAKHAMETVTRALFSANGGEAGKRLVADARRDVAGSAGLSDREKQDLTALFDAIDRVRKDPAPAATPAGGLGLPYEIRRVEAKSGDEAGYDGYAHSFGGMGVQFILLMGIDLGIKLLVSRRMGLWQRLRAAPVSRRLLLGSQVASGAIIATALFALIFGAGMVFFGVRVRGNLIGFVALIIAFAILTAAFGLLIAAIGRTPEATRGLAIFATLVMVMLGGAWVPAFVFPAWLQTASLAIPTRWAVDGFDAMTWRGLGLEAAWAPVLVMLGFSLVFGLVALWRFDWDEA